MPPLVDPCALWQSLPADVKDRLGALAIANELALQGSSSDTLDRAMLRFNEIAADECYGAISDIVATNLPDAFGENGEPHRPDLNQLDIRQCTTCGCTESHACEGRCSWTGPATCSSCTPPPQAA